MAKDKIILRFLIGFLVLIGLLIVISALFSRPIKTTVIRSSEFPSASISDNFGALKASFVVELATTSAQQAKGLMNRSALPNDRGMLFIFPEEKILSFWMKNTLIPLDMIFFNKDKQIVHIVTNAQPCTTDPCPSYTSSVGAQYFLSFSRTVFKV